MYTEKEELHYHPASTILTPYGSMETTSSIPSTFPPSFHFITDPNYFYLFLFLVYSNIGM
jgi:hypothetical protein